MSASIEFRREMIDVSTRGHHVGRPSWSHTDTHGHVHRFDVDELPTLELVVTGTYWCPECRDEHEESEWRCRICGDVIEPQWDFTGPEHRVIPGLGEWILTVDGQSQTIPVNSTEAEELAQLSGEALITRAMEIAAQREP